MERVKVDFEVLRHPRIAGNNLSQYIESNERDRAGHASSVQQLEARLNIERAKAKLGLFNSAKEIAAELAKKMELLLEAEQAAVGLDEIRRQRDELLASGISLKSGLSLG